MFKLLLSAALSLITTIAPGAFNTEPVAPTVLTVQLAPGITGPLQVGYILSPYGTPKINAGFSLIDPTSYDSVEIIGDLDGTSAVYGKQFAGIIIYSNAKKVTLRGFKVHAGDTSTVYSGMDSRGTNDYKGIELIARNMAFDGADPQGNLIGFRECINGYQTSPDFEDCEFINNDLGREHTVYIHGPATPAYYRFVRNFFGPIGSQHLKLVGRPHTDALLAQGKNINSGMYNAHEFGTPYNGAVVVTIESNFLTYSGIADPPQRGPGAIVFEGPCIESFMIRWNVIYGPGLAIGMDAVHDSLGDGRWYHPDGTIAKLPSTIIGLVDTNLMIAYDLTPNKPVIRFVDGIPGGSVAVLNNAIFGTGKIGQQMSGMIWLNNNSVEYTAFAKSIGIDVTQQPSMWDGQPIALDRIW